jgi:hypothetical protein
MDGPFALQKCQASLFVTTRERVRVSHVKAGEASAMMTSGACTGLKRS